MRYLLTSTLAIVFCTLLLSFFWVSFVFAGYPQAVDDYVNDFAQVLTHGDHERIRENFQRLEYQTGIEAVVVTIDSTEEYKIEDIAFEHFATNLFNYWGIGDRERNNGILILVAVRDRLVRIELGEGYSPQYGILMEEVVEKDMLPYFRDGEYSRGIYEGSKAVVENVTRQVPWYDFYKFHILLSALSIVFGAVGISLLRSGKKGWGWVFLAMATGIVFFLLKLFVMGKWRKGFKGGKSSGGGASGKW